MVLNKNNSNENLDRKYQDSIEAAELKCRKLLDSIDENIDEHIVNEYTSRDYFVKQISVKRGWISFWFKINRGSVLSISSVAAILILAVIILNPFSKKIDIEDQTSQLYNILPADGQVTIKLATGEIVPLDSSAIISERISGITLDNSRETISYQDISKEGDIENDSNSKSVRSQNNILNIPKGRSYSLVLSDGTKVWVNSESSIEYPIIFSGDTRVVKVNGEAFFDVKDDASKPFIVETNGYSVQVLGTKFNVKSYSDDDISATTLVSGAVDIVSNINNKKVSIKPGQQYKVDSNSGEYDVKEVDTDIYTSWIENRLKLDQMSLNDIVKLLMRRYDVDFFFSDEDARDELFNGVVPLNDNLNVILWQLSKVSSISFEIEGELIIVKRKF